MSDVMKEENNSKSDWFPLSKKQEKEEGILHPSMEGKGYEEIRITRDDVFGDLEKGWDPGFDTLQVREIPQFLLDKFSFAAQSGHLPRTYGHYLTVLEKAGCLDDRTLSALKKYRPEVEKAGSLKQQIEVLKPLIEYLGQLQMKKI